MPLSPGQIKQLLIQNTGWRGKDLDTAVAIAMAESGGNPTAYNPELASSYSRPGAGSRGLFQIFGAVHPKYNSDLAYDPATNARGAYEIYQQAGNKFTPWTTYTGGTYKNYLGSVSATGKTPGAAIRTATKGAGSVGSAGMTSLRVAAGAAGSVGSAGGMAIKTASGLAGALPAIEVKFPKVDWLNIGFIIAGAVLVILGIVFLFLKSEPGQRVVALGGEAAKLAAIGAL